MATLTAPKAEQRFYSLDPDQRVRLFEAYDLLTEHSSTIIPALQRRIEDFTQAADEAQAAYEAGQADPEVAAAQNASLVTNLGYKHTAALFREQADHARATLAAVHEFEDGPTDEDPA